MECTTFSTELCSPGLYCILISLNSFDNGAVLTRFKQNLLFENVDTVLQQIRLTILALCVVSITYPVLRRVLEVIGASLRNEEYGLEGNLSLSSEVSFTHRIIAVLREGFIKLIIFTILYVSWSTSIL